MIDLNRGEMIDFEYTYNIRFVSNLNCIYTLVNFSCALGKILSIYDFL